MGWFPVFQESVGAVSVGDRAPPVVAPAEALIAKLTYAGEAPITAQLLAQFVVNPR
jgi:hypothetical protein